MAFAVLAMGMIPAQGFRGHEGDPVALIAGHIPIIGIVAAPVTALIGGMIVFISANSGVVSASRLTYSMSQFKLLPDWFNAIYKKRSTPARTIVVFSGVAIVQTLFAFFTPGKPGSNAAIDLLTNLYAFGATSGYLLVFTSLIVLRFRDPYTPRPYKMPFNVPIRVGGRTVEFPVLGIVGMLGVSTILFEVILTHDVGRIAGPGWIILAVLLYLLHRRKQRMPMLGNIPRDWEATQRRVLLEAEEYESLEQYEEALAARDVKP